MSFFSEVLGLNSSMTVILPQNTYAQIGMQNVSRDSKKHPTLYLLHGRSDDDTTWVRRTSIERYVAPLGLAVIMPQVHLSYFTDKVEKSSFDYTYDEGPGTHDWAYWDAKIQDVLA